MIVKAIGTCHALVITQPMRHGRSFSIERLQLGVVSW